MKRSVGGSVKEEEGGSVRLELQIEEFAPEEAHSETQEQLAAQHERISAAVAQELKVITEGQKNVASLVLEANTDMASCPGFGEYFANHRRVEMALHEVRVVEKEEQEENENVSPNIVKHSPFEGCELALNLTDPFGTSHAEQVTHNAWMKKVDRIRKFYEDGQVLDVRSGEAVFEYVTIHFDPKTGPQEMKKELRKTQKGLQMLLMTEKGPQWTTLKVLDNKNLRLSYPELCIELPMRAANWVAPRSLGGRTFVPLAAKCAIDIMKQRATAARTTSSEHDDLMKSINELMRVKDELSSAQIKDLKRVMHPDKWTMECATKIYTSLFG